jgi:hypothetical protein
MSVKNFIPKIWAAVAERELEKAHVMARLCNRNYEGSIKNAGDTVKINGIGAVDVGSYTGVDITVQALADASTSLVIDQAKYFAFAIDDVDTAQINANVFGAGSQEAIYGLADTADLFIAGKYAEAGSTVTEAALNSSNITSTFSLAKTALYDNNVPAGMPLWAAISPIMVQSLVLAELLINTNNSAVLATGAIGTFLGVNIFMTNNLTSTGTLGAGTLAFKALMGTMNAMTFAEQIVKVEQFKEPLKFNKALKGLHVYGMKVVKPKQLVLLDVIIEDESSI